MGNRYLLLNVKLEVLKFGHIGELQLHLKDMWELSGMPSNDFCVHRGSDGALSSTISSRTGASRLASVERFVRGVHVPLVHELAGREDGRGPVPNSRLAAAAPSTREETGAQQHVGAVDRRESGPLGQLPPLMDPEKLRRLRQRQDASRRQRLGQEIVTGHQDRGETI